MKPTGGPVYPKPPNASVFDAIGMTLRDYFAGQAFAECLRVAADQTPGDAPLLSELFAKATAYAYHAADAMLAERDKP